MIQWEECSGQLVAELLFRDFSEAFSFVQIIAQLAEDEDHHPDLNWRYNKLHICLEHARSWRDRERERPFAGFTYRFGLCPRLLELLEKAKIVLVEQP